MREIVQGGFYRLLYMCINFGVGLLIAYLSGVKIFGVISIMAVNASIFHIISGLGTDSSIVWHGAKKNTGTNKLMTFTIASASFQILLFLLIAGCWMFFTKKTLLTGNNLNQVFVLEVIYLTGLVLSEKYIAVLYANQMSIVCNKIILSVIVLLFLILLPIYFGLKLFTIDPFSFYCFIPILQALPLIIFYHKKNIFQFVFISKIELHSLLSFSIIVFITNTIQFLAYRIDYWIILYYKDAGHLGVYAQANRFAQLLWVAPNIMAALLIPAIATPQSKLKEKDFARVFRVFVFASLLIMGAIILISNSLYHHFLPIAFNSGFKALLLMLPGFYFFTITIFLASWLSAHRLLWVNFYGSLICLAIIFILDLVLIPVLGINGAAIGNTIGYTSATIFTFYKFLKLSTYTIKDLFQIQRNDFKNITKLKLLSAK